MTALPHARTARPGIVDDVTNLQQKSNLGDLRDYLAGLFGTDGVAATARTALGVPSNAEAILDAIIDAKGDLIIGTAADTPVRLAIGVNGSVLIADSTQVDRRSMGKPGRTERICCRHRAGVPPDDCADRHGRRKPALPTTIRALRIVTGTVSSGRGFDLHDCFRRWQVDTRWRRPICRPHQHGINTTTSLCEQLTTTTLTVAVPPAAERKPYARQTAYRRHSRHWWCNYRWLRKLITNAGHFQDRQRIAPITRMASVRHDERHSRTTITIRSTARPM